MEKIRIIVDTASDITLEEAQALGIDLLPVTVVVKDKTYKEAYNMSKEEFWHILNTCDEMPSTCQITPEQMMDAYKRALADGFTHVIVVTISSTGSGMYNNAHIAKSLLFEELGECLTIEIIDSLAYSYLYGEPVMKAAQMVLQGADFQTTVDFLKDRLSRLEGYLCVFNLKYAKKSGRLSGVSAFVGEVLGFRPIMHLMNGRVYLVNKVRGEQEMLNKAVEMARSRAVNIESQTVYAMFGDLPQDKKELFLEKVRTALRPAAIKEGKIGCSVSLNTGPLVCAVLFEGEKRLQYVDKASPQNAPHAEKA